MARVVDSRQTDNSTAFLPPPCTLVDGLVVHTPYGAWKQMQWQTDAEVWHLAAELSKGIGLHKAVDEEQWNERLCMKLWLLW
mmetsp:Transcript_52089/g.85650  ORF Transcript_52089/g.85650 Transcript_52089/m.85650 type:complete len:82 (+) Transcript_52089:58-303(+)